MQLSLAKDRQFTYIDDAKKRGVHVRIFEGNERATFNKEAPKRFYHLIILDTSRGHPGLPSKELLTKEAWQGYLDSLADKGVVCVHTSSRDFRLEEVVASTTGSLGLAHLHVHDGIGDRNGGHYTSSWVLVARNAEDLKYIHDETRQREIMAGMRVANGEFTAGPARVNSNLVFTDGGANSLSHVKR